MGGRPVPHYANIFMSSIDKNIKQLDIMQLLLLFKRFLDDYFIIGKETSKQLYELFVEINSIHPSIKLTMSHTTRETEPEEDRCLCNPMTEIPFLDTLCKIKDGKIITDLHKKSTDRNQYLLPSSCHPTPFCQE